MALPGARSSMIARSSAVSDDNFDDSFSPIEGTVRREERWIVEVSSDPWGVGALFSLCNLVTPLVHSITS